MCDLYRVTTNVEAMCRLFAVTGPVPSLLLFGEIYPKREAPIIRADATGKRRIEVVSWGVSGPAEAKGPVANIRNLASPFWRKALQRPDRRCLVPVSEFCEWTAEPAPQAQSLLRDMRRQAVCVRRHRLWHRARTA